MKNEITERDYYGLRDSLLDSFFYPFEARENRNMMKTDVQETAEGYEMKIDLPGIDKSNVKIDFENGYLTVSAKFESKQDEKDQRGSYIRRERCSGSYSRSYYVGEIDRSGIKAKLADGVLELHLPKPGETKISAIEIE